MITVLLLIASFVFFVFSHSFAMQAHETKQSGWTFGMLILWTLGTMMAYVAGLVL